MRHMRQLRLKKVDSAYAFMYGGEENAGIIDFVKRYLTEKVEILKKYSYTEAPMCFIHENCQYQAGYVACEKETVVKLPDKGSVFVAGCEGGFIVATEYKSWQAG